MTEENLKWLENVFRRTVGENGEISLQDFKNIVHSKNVSTFTFEIFLVSISSTFYIQIFHSNVVLAAFSSYVLALSKNLYKKLALLTLMKLTAGFRLLEAIGGCEIGI